MVEPLQGRGHLAQALAHQTPSRRGSIPVYEELSHSTTAALVMRWRKAPWPLRERPHERVQRLERKQDKIMTHLFHNTTCHFPETITTNPCNQTASR